MMCRYTLALYSTVQYCAVQEDMPFVKGAVISKAQDPPLEHEIFNEISNKSTVAQSTSTIQLLSSWTPSSSVLGVAWDCSKAPVFNKLHLSLFVHKP